MKLTQNQKVKILGNTFKGIVLIGFASFMGLLIYKVISAEQKGRQRALQYERTKGKKKPKSLLPEQLQPQYIEKQRRKYKPLIAKKQQN